MSSLLGLPLEVALSRLEEQGILPIIEYTKAPRHPVETGQARVLRFDLESRRLLVAVFPPPLGDRAQGV